MERYESFFEKKKSTKELKLKVGDKVTQNTSGIEGTVLEKPEEKYVPIKWDGSSQTVQHVNTIKKVEV